MLKRAYQLYLKYTPVLILVALFLGVFLAKYIPAVMSIANFLISNLIDGIVFVAPIAIFVILAPSLAKMMKARKESSFAGFIVLWFGLTRIAAGAWAALFTVMILGFPMLPSTEAGTVSVGALVAQNFAVLKDLMLHSVFFGAIWLSIIVGVIAYHKKKLYNVLQKAAATVETLGDYIEPAIPILMLILGAYIYGLPAELAASVDEQTMAAIGAADIGKLRIFGWMLDVNSEFGLVWIYVVGSVLIGVGCFIWQGMQLCVVKKYIPDFSVKRFFTDYWMKVYPLAWCTSSEVISMPLNMALIKRGYKDIHRIVRRLVVGLGAYMNINGNTMHVILLGGIERIPRSGATRDASLTHHAPRAIGYAALRAWRLVVELVYELLDYLLLEAVAL